MAPIYLLTGMNSSPRIFAGLLPLLPGASVVPWIAPLCGESIAEYSQRLAGAIRSESACGPADAGASPSPPIVCGVSFGGIIARHLAAHLQARACVIVSSVGAPDQLPPGLRAVAKLAPLATDRALATVGAAASRVPAPFRPGFLSRLSRLAGHRVPSAASTPQSEMAAWYRWATGAFLRWASAADSSALALDAIPLTHIHGTHDTTFPIRFMKPDVVIPEGTHMLALSHPEVVADVINGVISDS